MSHIRPLGWIDTLVLTSRLRQVYWDRFEGDGGVQHIRLLDNIGEPTELLEGEKAWRGASTFMQRLADQLAPLNKGERAELGSAWIERVLGQNTTPWLREDDPESYRMMVALVSPPAALVYCGGDGVNMGVGVINLVDVAEPHCRANFGRAPAVYLVCDVRRPPPA